MYSAAAAAKSLQSCPTLCNPVDYSSPGSFIHGILQARILPFPSPGDLPDPEIEPRSPALQADASNSEPPGKLSAFLRLLIFLLAILIPACASSSPEFLMMYSAYKLNKQGDNIQPWHTPFPIWNQSVVPWKQYEKGYSLKCGKTSRMDMTEVT